MPQVGGLMERRRDSIVQTVAPADAISTVDGQAAASLMDSPSSQRMLGLDALVLVAFVVTLLFALRSRLLGSRRKFPDPPGPKPHPVVGHTFQVPKTKAWRYFEQLGKDHGPIVKLSLAGDDIVVLNDARDAEELLGRRSNNYSSRKPLVYAGKYLSNDKRLVLLPYGPTFRKQRQGFHQMLQPRAVGAYESMQLVECARLLHDTLLVPNDLNLNMKRFTASLVFNLSYGRRLQEDDADLKEVLRVLDSFIEDCYPGTHLVDTFPILDSWWVPRWMTPWRAEAEGKHQREIKFYLRLLHEVKSRMDAGDTGLECFAARLWDQKEKLDLDPESMAYIAGSAFEAGTGTTSGMLLFFVMAMILHPDKLKIAQDEIDRVLGDAEGPPTFEHMKELPYCTALVKEVFRWIPVAPGGFPHYSDKDDDYKGYYIRGGTMVIPNIWAMHRDPERYPEPEKFKPERFLRKNEADCTEPDSLHEGHFGFGFGRRTCPGQYMGAKTVWIGMVQLIWGFNYGHALDENGNEIPIDTDKVTSGINIEPDEFKVRITPRSERHATRIRNLWADYKSRM